MLSLFLSISISCYYSKTEDYLHLCETSLLKDWNNLSSDKRLLIAVKETKNLIKYANSSNIDLCIPIYKMKDTVNIAYGGRHPNFRGEFISNEKKILIYDYALEYQDKAVSTIMHEYCAHYMEEELDLI